MQKKFTLRMEKDVIERAKAYARTSSPIGVEKTRRKRAGLHRHTIQCDFWGS